MYRTFFGFTERPFQLVPNPAYLFLSKSHEEALAHLTYAISQGDGFVEITGEVGTGKTTLCRVFLESLTDSTEAAYIFNPKLNAAQLLKAINDDFGIDSADDTIKDLIDSLNRFLLKKKSENKTVLLIIDEAQNLEPEVLEQLRLLSNLETSTSKLIQIVLVGQPELRAKLDSHELRQLGQRITLSCMLQPLTFNETCDYIRHRLHIASTRPGIGFSRAAMKAVYRYSGGIPRRINIICDRTLLAAFAIDSRKVTGRTVRFAERELKQGRTDRKWRVFKPAMVAVSLLLLIAVAFAAVEKGVWTEAPVTVAKIESVTPEVPKEELSASALETEPEIEPDTPIAEPETEERRFSLLDVLDNVFAENSREIAMRQVLDLWKRDPAEKNEYSMVEDNLHFFRLIASQNQLEIYRTEEDIAFLLNLNLPSILEFEIPGYEKPLFLVLKGYAGGELFLGAGTGKTVTMRIDQADIYWGGVSYIPWRNFAGCEGTIPLAAPAESVVALKLLMRRIGYTDLEINTEYDTETEEAVREFQLRNGLETDGAVGSLTKMMLYNELYGEETPHIVLKQNVHEPLTGQEG